MEFNITNGVDLNGLNAAPNYNSVKNTLVETPILHRNINILRDANELQSITSIDCNVKPKLPDIPTQHSEIYPQVASQNQAANFRLHPSINAFQSISKPLANSTLPGDLQLSSELYPRSTVHSTSATHDSRLPDNPSIPHFKSNPSGNQNALKVAHKFKAASVQGAYPLADLFSESRVLYEQNVEAMVRCPGVHEAVQAVTVTVSTEGPAHKGVVVRVTDPRDPFFVYRMILPEAEYATFRDRHELHVDFAAFPLHIVALLSSVKLATGQFVATLVVTDTAAEFRVVEPTDFGVVQYLRLQCHKEGPEGQKAYLAERYQFFQSAYICAESKCTREAQQHKAVVKKCEDQIASLEKHNAELQSKLALDINKSDTEHMKEISSIREKLIKEMDSQRHDLESKYDIDTKRLKDELSLSNAKRDELINQLRESEKKCLEIQHDHSLLVDKYKRMEEQSHVYSRSSEDITSQFSLLQSKHSSILKMNSEQELQLATLTEKTKYLSELNTNKDLEIKGLRKCNVQNEEVLKTLNDTNSATITKNKELESNLRKSHYIIKTMLESQKLSKEQEKNFGSRLAEKDSLIKALESSDYKSKLDLKHMEDRVGNLQLHITQLKDQLKNIEKEKADMSEQLKRNENAMIHMSKANHQFINYTTYEGTFKSHSPEFPNNDNLNHTAFNTIPTRYPDNNSTQSLYQSKANNELDLASIPPSFLHTNPTDKEASAYF